VSQGKALSNQRFSFVRAILQNLAYKEDVMKTRVTVEAVEADLIQLLMRLISEGDSGQPPIERAGKDLTCSQPKLGRWIDDCDVPFLFQTLALPDDVFDREFPGIRLSQKDRESFAKTLDTHCTECARCNAKRAEDGLWQSRVDKAFVENKQAIGHFLTGKRKP
jgi:hypothetical protein